MKRASLRSNLNNMYNKIQRVRLLCLTFCVKADGRFGQYPAVKTREIVNTIGAGDALFSAFIHFYAKDGDPYEAIRRAIVFASYKIGEKGAASGFVDESKITELLEKQGISKLMK